MALKPRGACNHESPCSTVAKRLPSLRPSQQTRAASPHVGLYPRQSTVIMSNTANIQFTTYAQNR